MMLDLIQGTFHFHSTYSHDGRSTLSQIATGLSRQGLSFCIMTEHFEDFNEPKFDRYIREIDAISKSNGFLLIPGMEVDITGLHTIVFPVRDYGELVQLASGDAQNQPAMFRVLAHPSKYPFERVAEHLEKYKIDGIELWNQQADGGFVPPLRFLESLRTQPGRAQYRYFFGCDIHNVNLKVKNIISLETSRHQTSQAIINALISGAFVSRNDPTEIEYRNGSDGTDFDTWVQTLLSKPDYRGRLLLLVRRCLRSSYKMLPRRVQHSLNDVKNFVRNKV